MIAPINSPEENTEVCLRIQQLKTYAQEAPATELNFINTRISLLESYQNLLYYRVYLDPNWQA